MRAEDFEKKIGHLSRKYVQLGASHVLAAILTRHADKLTGKALINLNRILIANGITTKEEIQKEFLAWMEKEGLLK